MLKPKLDSAKAQQIADAMTRAETLAGSGHIPAAVQAFALARALCVDLAGPATLGRIVARNEAIYRAERETHRAAIAARRPEGRGLVIFADSLGLPRPVPKGGAPIEQRVYPELLADALPDRAVTSIAQRFFTTAHVLSELQADPSLGSEGADIILHVGLNDCANRMFLEYERLSLDLLPEDVSARVVTFSQKNRRAILRHLAPRHYVSPEMFAANLDAILALLKARGAGRVLMATIILPPVRSWPATPGLNMNFGNYNRAIMTAAWRHEAILFDIDRHIWQAQHRDALLPDGMHLATEGHRIFAKQALALLS